jgi:hypothetical protein
MSMKRTGMLACVAATSLIGLLAMAQPSGAASAVQANGRTPVVTCTSIKGSENLGATLTLGGCTGATGGSGTVEAPFFTPSVIHWASGGSTTVIFNGHVQPHSTPTCATAVTLKDGRVAQTSTGGMSKHFRASFCFHGRRFSLVPGTVMTF